MPGEQGDEEEKNKLKLFEKTVDNGGRVWYSNKAFREGGTEMRRDRVENRTAAEKSA